MHELDKALAVLAEKLGTNVEHLWGVLIRQAPIDGTVDLLQYALITIGCWLWWRWCKRVMESNQDEIIYLPLTLVAVALGILVIAAFFCLPNTVAAFLNPEYWALKQVLGSVNP